MKVVITGGAGFLGKKLARRILQQGEIAGPSGRPEKVSELLLFDVARASGPGLDDPRVKALDGDISNFATVQSIMQGAATVFHFAAVVSAGAEADFDLGYRVNLDGTRNVLEACRALGTNPRVVFTSSLAAFGGDLPPAVTDDTPLTPQTSYGSQKSIGEFLVRDYTRKGFLRGTSVRLPTICVRPAIRWSTWAVQHPNDATIPTSVRPWAVRSCRAMPTSASRSAVAGSASRSPRTRCRACAPQRCTT